MKYEAVLQNVGAVLSAVGIAVLAYRAYLSLGGQFGYRVWEMAMLAAVRLAPDGDVGFASGLVETFDFDRLRSLLRQRVDAQIGVLLVIGGMLLSLGGLSFPGRHSERSVIVGAFVLGLLLAWGLTKGYGYLWRWRRERWWLAHAWLTWLERQIPNPLAPTLNVAQDFMHIVLASRHPDLQQFHDARWAGQKYHPLTVEDREATEQWVADFAVRWKHRFESQAWNEWVARRARKATRPQAPAEDRP